MEIIVRIKFKVVIHIAAAMDRSDSAEIKFMNSKISKMTIVAVATEKLTDNGLFSGFIVYSPSKVLLKPQIRIN